MTGDLDIVFDAQALDALLASPTGPVGADLLKRAIRVETEVKRLTKQPGRGRVYRKYNPRRDHRASAPGDPPATDQGHLSASYGHAVGKDGQGLYAQVGTGLKKGRWLELGTRTIDPRPALRPALAKAGS